MSEPQDIPLRRERNHGDELDELAKSMSPGSPKVNLFLVPSPLPTRRTRTYSQTERVRQTPRMSGKVKEFCRNKGHGFVIPNDDPKLLLFVHISDIEGEWVPKAGDDVTFQKCLIPPKNEKCSAVNVRITHLAEGVSHERWEDPIPKE